MPCGPLIFSIVALLSLEIIFPLKALIQFSNNRISQFERSRLRDLMKLPTYQIR